MLAKKLRLTGKKNFEDVKENGKLFQSESFGIAFLENNLKDLSRFAFVVSKKIAADAVQRNRAKRAMSEAIRLFTSEIKEGYDIVFLAKQAVLRKSTEKIMIEVKNALKDASLTK